MDKLTGLRVPWVPRDTTDGTPKPPDEPPTMEALLTRAESLIAELQGIIDDVRANVKAL